jgi:hypothetical protein
MVPSAPFDRNHYIGEEELKEKGYRKRQKREDKRGDTTEEAA